MPTYDVLYDPAVGNADWIDGPLRAPLTTGSVEAKSYCFAGGRHFLACLNEGTLEVNMWDGAGSLTTFAVGNFGPPLSGGTGYYKLVADLGDELQNVLLRTDGENVWLVAHRSLVQSFADGDFTVWGLAVLWFDGTEFVDVAFDQAVTDNISFESAEAAGTVGRIAACASSAEPGVIYAAWTENGSLRNLAFADPDYVTVGPPDAQRMSIVKCDTVGLVWQFDLFHQVSGTGIRASAYDPHFETYGQPVVTQHIFMSNGAGSPLLFWGKPTNWDTTSIAPRDVSYSDGEVWMIDLVASSMSAPAVLQILTGTDFDAAATGLISSAQQDPGIGGSYGPETIAGQSVVYVTVPWSDDGLMSGSAAQTLVGLADGSEPFTVVAAGLVNGWWMQVIAEGDDIWLGSVEDGVGRALVLYHRPCSATESLGEFVPDVGGPVATIEGPEFAIDGDILYVPGRSITPDTKSIGIVAVNILRGHGNCGFIGLHVWQRI